MNQVDRKKFFDGWRSAFGRLSQEQVDGLDHLLDNLEGDNYVQDIRHAAYMLATTRHETAGAMQPVHEYGTRDYFIKRYGSHTKVGKALGNDTPEDGAVYAGRGDVQLTGENNYEMAERELREHYPKVVADFEARTGKKFDLTVGDQTDDAADPDNVCDPAISYCIMSYGMRSGMFTGVGLKRYINDERCDYLHARKIINGMDCAELIAAAAVKIETILKFACSRK